jgi:hypothetical protein
MKTPSLPKQITDLTTAIKSYQAECERRHADIERASLAFTEAARLTGELEALALRRAELKAQAFISRQPADLKEVDAQEEKLERASRAARSDGSAAEIAIGILRGQLAELAIKISAATEERRQLSLAWLEDRRERALDRYMVLIAELGLIVAEAFAADKAQGALGDLHWSRRPGTVLLEKWHEIERGALVPNSRKTWNESDPMHPRQVCPITWFNDRELGKPELAALLAQLHDAGVLPLVTDDAAIEESATSAAA